MVVSVLLQNNSTGLTLLLLISGLYQREVFTYIICSQKGSRAKSQVAESKQCSKVNRKKAQVSAEYHVHAAVLGKEDMYQMQLL